MATKEPGPGRCVGGMAALLAVVVSLLPASTSANGRYPQTVSVHFQPGNSQRIAVGATFGLLLSEDDGATWRWTCEQNVGYGGVFDPVYEISSTGVLYASTFDGLSISRDGGCNWSYAGGGLTGHWAGDVTIASDGAVWVATTSGGMPNDVFVSRDDGQSFASAGLIHDRAWWKSVRVAPTNPQRIYVTGYQLPDDSIDGGNGMPSPLLYRSDDGGQGWTQLPFAYEDESQFFILGVSPTDPEMVYGRINGTDQDTLLRSTDGAMSWTPVLEFVGDGADIVGFAALKDGQTVIAGTVSFGSRISTDGGETWSAPPQQVKMSCVGERPSDGAMFYCGSNWNPDRMAIGRSTDSGQSWSKVMRFVELDDELSCPGPGGHFDKCAGLWQGIAMQFGIGAADAGPVDASVGDGGGGNGGTGGGASGCGGCGVALASVLFVSPWGRRRRKA